MNEEENQRKDWKQLCGEDEHNFVKFGYRHDGYSFVCTECPKAKIVKTDDFKEEDLPINLVLQRAKNDCGIAAIAMLLKLDYEVAYEDCKDYLDNEDFTIRKAEMMRAFLESRGLQAIFYTWNNELPCTLTELCDPDETLLVILESIEGEGHYVLSYNGLVYCPTCGVVEEKTYLERFPDEIIGVISVKE